MSDIPQGTAMAFGTWRTVVVVKPIEKEQRFLYLKHFQ